MDWLWTWGGECFGYRTGDKLFTYGGRQVGQFHGDEVYGADGSYLGEIKGDKRLIANSNKKSWSKPGFSPVQGGSYARFVNYVGNVMYVGFEDFPSPDSFK